MLPAIALLASAMVAPPVTKIANSEKEGWRVLPLWLIAGALVVSLAGQSKILFRMSPDQVSRAAYPSVPFVEAVAVGDYLRAHLGKDARIAVMGSEPEIYFYAQCRSVTSYIYVYPLMDPRPFFASMQEEFIHDVESAAPEYMVLVNNGYSWLQQPQSSTRVFVWFAAYYPQHYEQVGLAEMFPGHTDYLWDAAATSAVPKSRSFVAVYERKAGKVL
jgi:hypothetical protein